MGESYHDVIRNKFIKISWKTSEVSIPADFP